MTGILIKRVVRVDESREIDVKRCRQSVMETEAESGTRLPQAREHLGHEKLGEARKSHSSGFQDRLPASRIVRKYIVKTIYCCHSKHLVLRCLF